MASNSLPLSLVIITLNEESNLKACIESVPFASDIVILDSYSKDKTKEIALQLGARFIEQKWLGFGPQKRKAVEAALNDWVLCLDADERLSSEAQKDILEQWNRLDPKSAYAFPRISFHLGKWIRYGGWYPDYQTRLFHRQHSQWNDALIHEKVKFLNCVYLKNPIEHYVFKNISDQVTTNDRYSTLQAKDLYDQKKSFSWVKLFIKPVSKFIECYFFKLGFLDGFPGYFIAVSASYSVFLKWSKLKELYRSQKDNA